MSVVSERCLPFDEDLSALLDGELDAARAAELRAHLDGCADCRARLAAWRGVDAALRGLVAPAVRPELAASMAARLGAERAASGAPAQPQVQPLRRTPSRPAVDPSARSAGGGRRVRRGAMPVWLGALAAAAVLAFLVLPRVPERTRLPGGQGAPPNDVARRESVARQAPPLPVPQRGPGPAPIEIARDVHKPPAPAKLGAGAADAPLPSGDPALAQLEAASDEDLALAIAVQDAGDVESADDLALVEQLDQVESLDDLDQAGHG